MEQTTATTTPIIDNNNKKGENGLKIIAMVASIVAVCGIGFGIYGMILGSQKDDLKVQIRGNDGTITTIKTPEIETNTVNETTVTITDSNMVSLKQVRNLLYEYIDFDYFRLSEDKKLFESGLTDQYKYFLSMKKINYSNKASMTYENINMPARVEYSFSYDDLNNVYHSLFGFGSNIQNQENLWCSLPVFSKEHNKYISYFACGGLDPSTYDYEILDYSVKDDELDIDIAYIRVFYDDNNQKKITLKSGDKEIRNENSYYLDTKYVKDYESELLKYRFTFKKEGSGYILASINKI